MLNKLIRAGISASLLLLPSIFADAQDLIPDQNAKGKWGYVDSSGKKIINYDFNEAKDFVEGRAKVKKGNKWGYIGPDGKEVIKIQYSDMLTWDNGRCKVAVGGQIKDDVLTGAKWGFINTRGEVLLKPEYEEIGVFKNGVAHVKKGGKYGYIDTSYKFVIPCKFTSIGAFNDKGYCWVAEKDKYGVYNINGDEIIKPSYRHIGTFTQTPVEANAILAQALKSEKGLALAEKKSKEMKKGLGGKSFMAGLTGNTTDLEDEIEARSKKMTESLVSESADLISAGDLRLMTEAPAFDLLGYEFIEGKLFSMLDMSRSDYFAVSNAGVAAPVTPGFWTMGAKINDKIGIVDRNGTVILRAGSYGTAFLPSEGLIPVVKKKGKKFEINYLYESTGKLLMKKWLSATSVTPFVNGVAVVPDGENQYLIDNNGRTISGSYNLVMPQSNGVHIMKKGNVYGLLSSGGSEILAPDYYMILPENDGLYCAQATSTGQIGYIDGTGKYVIEPQYSAGISFSNGTAGVCTKDGWGMIDRDNRTVIGFQWLEVMPFSSNDQVLCWVKDASGWRCLDRRSGRFAFNEAYHAASNFNSDNLSFVSDSNGRCGCIDTEGHVVIPMALSDSKMVTSCLEYMRQNDLTEMKHIDAYRFNAANSEGRNNVRLSQSVSPELWDY